MSDVRAMGLTWTLLPATWCGAGRTSNSQVMTEFRGSERGVAWAVRSQGCLQLWNSSVALSVTPRHSVPPFEFWPIRPGSSSAPTARRPKDANQTPPFRELLSRLCSFVRNKSPTWHSPFTGPPVSAALGFVPPVLCSFPRSLSVRWKQTKRPCVCEYVYGLSVSMCVCECIECACVCFN